MQRSAVVVESIQCMMGLLQLRLALNTCDQTKCTNTLTIICNAKQGSIEAVQRAQICRIWDRLKRGGTDIVFMITELMHMQGKDDSLTLQTDINKLRRLYVTQHADIENIAIDAAQVLPWQHCAVHGASHV